MSSSKIKSDEPVIGIIANSTSWENRALLVKELGEPHDGFFNPMPFTFQRLRGEIIPLDIQPNEIETPSGMAKGKVYMTNAVDYLASSDVRDIKVICFTASTKRLPGKNGNEVKKRYPDITFSIGDNATTLSLLRTINHFLDSPDFDRNSRIVCLGAGFLGTKAIEHLMLRGYREITIISEQKASVLPKNIEVVRSIDDLQGDIKLFLSCSHKYKIDPLRFKNLVRPDAVIIDVAVPPGIRHDVFITLPETVIRIDAGDFFLGDVKYDFLPKILSFPQVGFWYGCFTEAIMLGVARQNGDTLASHNFFEVNRMNLEKIEEYLRREKVYVPLINFFRPEKSKLLDFQAEPAI